MFGTEPTSGIGSDRCTNWAINTTQLFFHRSTRFTISPDFVNLISSLYLSDGSTIFDNIIFSKFTYVKAHQARHIAQ